uniref:Lipoyl synthase n=1 Tax=Chlorobium chlorochromatii (strain CaD3) TaxID=340177 RepID=LIPA_CHLCH|nr:RecName: Full=Lipoyl synthase; AltName: Full=Lip-syn; Short=LS; AltName: Full=Lipoate synthase; AltName: Full=Lipoic acid synthase; AltName: Full=Sulfur insertion protein LipA [Chlorobium chlorochromatii CaD3]
MAQPIGRKPEWLKIKMASGASFAATRQLLNRHSLHTVCRSALCPNLQECWSRGTATFLLLGNTCTRSCTFCAVSKASAPPAPDSDEPQKIAEAIASMKLKHAVLTSVTRDDLPDGGANHWIATMQAIRQRTPNVSLECLIPDFQHKKAALDSVMQATPDVLNHNIESVPSLYSTVRPQANYRASLELLRYAKEQHGLATKSGLMVGMGEERHEVEATLHDLAAHGCDMVTIGQYLQPSAAHLPVARYVPPQEFEEYSTIAKNAGIRYVHAAPFVRSSYHAETFPNNLTITQNL